MTVYDKKKIKKRLLIEKLIVFCTTDVQYTAYDINNPFNNVISKLKKPLTKQIMEKKKKK